MISWWHYAIATSVAALAIWALSACASPEVNALLSRQRQIQDCILSGGHPHLGPGDTILCD